MTATKHEALLTTVGTRVRSLREQRALSRRQLADSSGLSERFLAELESGRGNISLARFADVAAALGTTPAELLHGAGPSARAPEVVALLGVRGAGKSSVGTRLAAERGVPFVEVDQEIEQTAGLRLSEIFELHGEAYYRRIEREVLSRLLDRPGSSVLAAGGSIVNHRENFALLRARACTVWLRASPEDHWNRVIRQGDRRPMAKNPHAFSELKALLAARAPLYGLADHVIDTSDHRVDEVVALVSAAVGGEAEAAPAPRVGVAGSRAK